MLKLQTVLLSILCFSCVKIVFPYRIGLCIMATGGYTAYAQKLIESARKYFLKGHNVTYFVFTDGSVSPASDVVQIQQPKLGWPYDTLMRFAVYAKHEKRFMGFDYMFASDADMLFVAPVGEEILGVLVATKHADFGQCGPYEVNEKSVASVAPHEGQFYYAGGFYGARSDVFCAMIHHLRAKIAMDLEKKYIAVWHDESHLNRFFIDYPPTVILSPSYCYMEGWDIPYEPKLIALSKNSDVYASRSLHTSTGSV